MSSAIDICNQALLMLGSKPIVSFEDETTEANACKVMYAPAKAQLLRSFDWNCANKTATLATLNQEPVNPGWNFVQALPDDYIRLLDIVELGVPVYHRVEWAVEGRTVYTQVANVVARYVADVPEPQLDAHVEMVLVARMAMDMAYALTGDTNREAQMSSLYGAKLEEARTTDAQERSHRVFRIDQLARARL